MARTSALWTRRSTRETTQAAFGKTSPFGEGPVGYDALAEHAEKRLAGHATATRPGYLKFAIGRQLAGNGQTPPPALRTVSCGTAGNRAAIVSDGDQGVGATQHR